MTKARNIGPLRVRPQMVKGKATGKWIVDIPKTLTGNGKRMRRLFDSKAKAEAVASEVKKKLNLRKLGFVEEQAQSSLTFTQGATDWQNAHQSAVRTGNMHPKTLETRGYELKALKAFLGKHRLSEIDRKLVEQYQVHRLEQGCAVRTVNSEVATLKQVLRWLQAEGHSLSIPAARAVKLRRQRVNSHPIVTPFSRPIVTPLGAQEWAYPRSA